VTGVCTAVRGRSPGAAPPTTGGCGVSLGRLQKPLQEPLQEPLQQPVRQLLQE
jgi:hypothetical protein